MTAKIFNQSAKKNESEVSEIGADSHNYDEWVLSLSNELQLNNQNGENPAGVVKILREAVVDFPPGDFNHHISSVREALGNKDQDALDQSLGRILFESHTFPDAYWFEMMAGLEIRSSIIREVGKMIFREDKDRLNETLKRLWDKREKIDLMLGFSEEMTNENPNEAFHLFHRWALGQEIDAVNRVPELIEMLPETTNFKDCDDAIPRDYRELAIACRKAIYQRWAKFRPVELVDHLLSLKVYDNQLHTALVRWGERDSRALFTWIEQVEQHGENSPAWSFAKRMKAQKLLVKDPEGAWNAAIAITDKKIRDSILKGIHVFWSNEGTEEKGRADLAMSKYLAQSASRNEGQ